MDLIKGVVGMIAWIPYSIGILFFIISSAIIFDFKHVKALATTWDCSVRS